MFEFLFRKYNIFATNTLANLHFVKASVNVYYDQLLTSFLSGSLSILIHKVKNK